MATICGLLLQLAKAELRVELVQVLFRHGERTPREKEMYPNDPYDISTYEPWGLGQLTNKGKMREYCIGKMLRRQYDDFLGDTYHASDVYAMSSNVDRTKMSLQLTLAALYHPNQIQTWNKNLSWIPIPTYYMPEKVDTLFKPHLTPLYRKALAKVKKSDEIREKASVFNDTYKFLRAKTGLDKVEASDVYELYNLLASQRGMNLTLPDWCTDDVYKKIQEIVRFEYEVRYCTTELKRLSGGMLVKKFIKNMHIDKKSSQPRKIYLYSGHEINIASFAKAHNLTEPQLPGYGSAILVEKLRNKKGELFVRFLLWTGESEQLSTYELPECGEICSVDKYLDLVSDIIPSYEEENYVWDTLSKKELHQLHNEDETAD